MLGSMALGTGSKSKFEKLSYHYLAEISVNVTLNHNQPTNQLDARCSNCLLQNQCVFKYIVGHFEVIGHIFILTIADI